MLLAVLDMQELRQVVFSLSKDSATGADDFNGVFFQTCWEIIADDLLDAVVEFFQGTKLRMATSSTLICLIPKVENLSSCADIRPISLCSFVKKVITKIVANRLQPLLPTFISEEQNGFVTGRNISDDILLVQKLAEFVGKKVREGNMMLNLMWKKYLIE
ncbi:hypothetical protein ACH5RR_000847 [Cinchona calisaya]|uniref:Reverse transcriptase domain-containing protein n=1 Tax=Cinchona calisaya TaxID=153742 RepID=A0ABD3B1Y9_9GENT